jgi:hypothetical protein
MTVRYARETSMEALRLANEAHGEATSVAKEELARWLGSRRLGQCFEVLIEVCLRLCS